MTPKLAEEIQAAQCHGRQKYGTGPNDLAHDDQNPDSVWHDCIQDHNNRAREATPVCRRDHLIKLAGLAVSAIESYDRKAHEVFYFGCKDVPGHFIYSNRGSRMSYHDNPFGKKLDGGLLSLKDIESNLGRLQEYSENGWTAIAFWDRSGDSRPGSNSVFFVHADVTMTELLAMARAQWPALFSRFPRIVLGSAPNADYQ